jgi:hypothetical protein
LVYRPSQITKNFDILEEEFIMNFNQGTNYTNLCFNSWHLSA